MLNSDLAECLRQVDNFAVSLQEIEFRGGIGQHDVPGLLCRFSISGDLGVLLERGMFIAPIGVRP
jgi:hypothetical protein